MAKIDQGHYTPTAKTSGSSVAAKTSATSGATAVVGLQTKPFRQRVGSYLGLTKLRKLLSPLQVTDVDLSPITQRSDEEVITDLSRILLALENEQEAGDEEGQLLQMMLRENIRRMMIVYQFKSEYRPSTAMGRVA